jgi:dolichyl-phosphate-mannose-protein mannosyltransferase
MATIAPTTPRRLWAMPVRADWFAATALVLVALATRALWFTDPVADFDEQIYSLIGWRMTYGDLPFVQVWDRKPFGLFAIFALAHWLFGPDPLAYQIFGFLSALVGALLVYVLAKPLADRLSATIAGALYLMLIAAYGSYSGQSEIFHTPMMLGMLWLVRDPRRPDAAMRATGAMLLGGLALQVKYTVLPQCLFFGAYALFGEWRAGAPAIRLARRAVVFALLGVLPTALVALLYLGTGHFDQFWFANFVSFFDRTPASGGRLRSDLMVAILPLALLIGLGLYAALRLNPPRDWRLYGLFAGWALAAVGTILLPATVYLYYYGALVPAAVLMAVPLIDIRAPARFIPAAALLFGAWYITDMPDRYVHSQNERRTEARLSADIMPYVGAKRDCLYVFDGPAVLYRTTGTCLPTRYLYPDHLNNGLEIHSLEVDQPTEIARILANRPGVIVTADRPMTVQRPENLDLIRDATQAGYVPLTTASLHHREVTAWVRRDLAHR